MTRRLLLGAFLFHPGGAHVTGWRHPSAEPDRHLDPDFYAEFARTAERGVFDTIFLADGLYLWDRYPSGIDHYSQVRPEPLTLLSALVAHTRHIGLAATVSTTYNEPYHVARALASLDHLSGGRAGWNLVTSRYDEEARNFGGDAHLDHSRRYERGAEFVRVVERLWDSWGDDAILADKASGRFADASKLTTADHRGEFFTVRGPLNITRPPQGHPVQFQAGGSPAGQDLAASTADAVFTRWQPLGEAQAFYAGLKARVVDQGRDPDRFAILPSIRPVVASSRAEAEDLAEELLASTPDALIVEDVSHTVGQDLTGRSADEPFTYRPDTDTSNESQSPNRLAEWSRAADRVTARELYARAFREQTVVGTPQEVADEMEARFRGGAADGFIVQFLTLPSGIHRFVDLVVPELQRRGLTRTGYAERTLRERFGLERPRVAASIGETHV
ncbi:LLM class flavin-dependent oxidoreductase [Agromyces badenianii]|uniref:LLM class flavin-dependent oxidoreductase n=1 Tax=Agromyces badenianii TaxID=2080742 RepID=UPI000D59F4BB|nr:LLM class flavin-dependent oxidoreductase [Agromyces badenianii]PWC03526.1 LLM class flavin-dependent oxidoreductase [Agromyces badenianii]